MQQHTWIFLFIILLCISCLPINSRQRGKRGVVRGDVDVGQDTCPFDLPLTKKGTLAPPGKKKQKQRRDTSHLCHLFYIRDACSYTSTLFTGIVTRHFSYVSEPPSSLRPVQAAYTFKTHQHTTYLLKEQNSSAPRTEIMMIHRSPFTVAATTILLLGLASGQVCNMCVCVICVCVYLHSCAYVSE